MLPTPSKKPRLDNGLLPPQTPTSARNTGEIRTFSPESSIFFSSPPIARAFPSSPFKSLPKTAPTESAGANDLDCGNNCRQSSPIGPFENPVARRLAARQRLEKEDGDEEVETSGGEEDNSSEAEANRVFICEDLSSDGSLSEVDTDTESEEDGWEDEEPKNRPKIQRLSWIDSGNTDNARRKLIKILKGEALVPKQRWGLRKILSTLIYHRKDENLRSAYRQFRSFAYQSMMTETEEGGRWPGALTKKDCNLMVRLRFQAEMERGYGREVQRLCKTSSFGMLRSSRPGDVDRAPLENIIDQAKQTAPMLSSLVLSVGPTSTSAMTSHLVSMKLVAILVILCRSAHRNNSNYLPLLVALYLYSAGARIDAITLLNHLGLSVSHNVLLRKLRDITKSSVAWIKAQVSNCRLVGSWDNFEYRENVHGERVGDTVKFRSVTMALWVKNGWRIPSTGLKQWMWNPRRDMLDPEDIASRPFNQESCAIRLQCTQVHRFKAFQTGFPRENFSYTAKAMPKLNIIDCKREGKTEAYAFAPSMFSESSLIGNIGVFEDLNVIQMGIEKTDPRWEDWLTIWWGDLKTEVQMLGMQAHGVKMDRAYDRYQHIFPGLALWHLRFNYLKMVWELFYPGGSATERSTLQWAADHWHRDKTTKPTDFHSLEDLTIHSYRARVIAILKPWMAIQTPELQLHDNELLGRWLSQLTPQQWIQALDWLDARMKEECVGAESWNDHWNNHVRFCRVMEPYMTLCYAIKHGDTGLLRHAMREVCVILQAPSACKPKYAREMMRQVHIFDTKAADPILQEAYLANALVNLRGLPDTFYEMDLLLEHQNGEFKRFRADRGSSLQESDEMFRLHALSVDTLKKVRSSMNRIIIGQERGGRHPQKDSSFDILSLADQLHRSKSTIPEGPEQGKIYFSENQVPNLVKQGKTYLHRAIRLYNETIGRERVHEDELEVQELSGKNENINELFNQAREEASVTSELIELDL